MRVRAGVDIRIVPGLGPGTYLIEIRVGEHLFDWWTLPESSLADYELVIDRILRAIHADLQEGDLLVC